MVKGLAFGAIAGLLGTAVWAAIAYYGNIEIGWIAWGIGGAVGFAVSLGAGSATNPTTGVLAVVITVLSILGGKYAYVQMDIDRAIHSEEVEEDIRRDIERYVSDDVGAVELMADEILYARGIDPMSLDYDSVDHVKEAYPDGVWEEASAEWFALDDQGKRDKRRELVETNVAREIAFLEESSAQFTNENFIANFGLMDIVFFGIAVVIAFKLGSASEEEA